MFSFSFSIIHYDHIPEDTSHRGGETFESLIKITRSSPENLELNVYLLYIFRLKHI